MASDDLTGGLIIAGTIFGTSWYTLHVVAAQPRGAIRLVTALPVFAANLLLPFVVDPTKNGVGSIILSAFFGWWANFKVLALCWGRGPLASARSIKVQGPDDPVPLNRPMGLLQFTARLSLPVVIGPFSKPEVEKAQEKFYEEFQVETTVSDSKDRKKTESGFVDSLSSEETQGGKTEVPLNGKSNGIQREPLADGHTGGANGASLEEKDKTPRPHGRRASVDSILREPIELEAPWQSLALQSLTSLVFFNFLIYLLDFRPHMPGLVVLFIYCLLMYNHMLFMFNASAAAIKGLSGLTFAPHFKRPYLASSLQDFWGHRWNLVASGLLREAIYAPLKEALQKLTSRIPVVRRLLPTALAVVVAFVISGIMHEFIIYNAVGHLNGLTLEWVTFFTIHGFLLMVEIVLKKMWSALGLKPIPKVVSIPITLWLLVSTAQVYFFPPITRNGFDVQAVAQFRAMLPGYIDPSTGSVSLYRKEEL